MGKRNKIRYTSEVKEKKRLILTGNVYLQFVDEEKIDFPVIGDLKAYPRCEALQTTKQGDYYTTGFSGYFKFDVWDGKQWCLVLLEEFFPQREHHFSKTECPIDTYELCVELLTPWTGKALERTYREHYQAAEEA